MMHSAIALNKTNERKNKPSSCGRNDDDDQTDGYNVDLFVKQSLHTYGFTYFLFVNQVLAYFFLSLGRCGVRFDRVLLLLARVFFCLAER